MKKCLSPKIARDWKNEDEKTILHIVKMTRTVDWYRTGNPLIEPGDEFGENMTPCHQRVYDPWCRESVSEHHKGGYNRRYNRGHNQPSSMIK